MKKRATNNAIAVTSKIADRFHARKDDGLFDQLELVDGTAADYHALCEHHYRNHRPATMMRVLAFRLRKQHPLREFPSRVVGDSCVAVLIESMPPLDSRMRNAALGNRYGSVHDRRVRAAMINRDVRTISRVIVHPQWRGLGLARRLVQAALGSATTPLTEAFAAMGRVHPFFSQAGMTAYPRPPHEHDARLRAVLRSLGIDDVALASISRMLHRIGELPADHRQWLTRELQRWFRSSHRRQADVTLNDMLRAAQRALICEPVYFLHDNRG